ncbi:MAG: hypothetical protein JSV43_03745 [Methanobacteriota archaeon]|nr:MAG: hypothetical protein JSV43_03745 [Euryarchaeota archaeon]
MRRGLLIAILAWILLTVVLTLIALAIYPTEGGGESFDTTVFWTVCGGLTAVVMVLILVIVYYTVFRIGAGAPETAERPPVSQQPSVVATTVCPYCGAYSSRGDFCTQCGRKLR